MSSGRINEINEDIINAYGIEYKSVFETQELDKIKIPQEFNYEKEYQINRSDVDFIGHVHNLYYLNLAYNALPENVYNLRPFNSFRITYKREIKLSEKVRCKYSLINDKHTVVIYDETESKVHSIIELQ